MNINSTSNYVSPFATAQRTQSASQVTGTPDSDGDGDSGTHVHKSHGGGHMHQALAQALQNLGLSVPQDAGVSAPNPADATGNADNTTSGTSDIKQDLHKFMHALFEAVKSESSSTDSSTSSAATDPKANFATGLSTLISQVSNGSAPAELQSAFSKLVADLQAPNATSGSSTTATNSTGSTGATAPQATLGALLTALQQDLGYGASSASGAGNVISAQV